MKDGNTRLIDLTLQDLFDLVQAGIASEFDKRSHLHSSINESEYMDVAECAALTKYSKDYVRQLVYHQKIPYQKINRAVRFSRKDIRLWMDSKKIKTIEEKAYDYLENNNRR